MNDSIQPQIHSLLFGTDSHSAERAHPQFRALEVARIIQNRATQLQTAHERDQQHELDQLIQNPADKATLMSITDQAFRSESPRRSMDQLIHILDIQGIPQFFGRIDRTLLKGLQTFGSYLPGVATPLVREKMQRETANVILPADEDHLCKHLRQRQAADIRMNVNLLGEAVLGEQEAQRRLIHYHKLLELDDLEVLSVKISNLYSQISPLAREHSVENLCNRLGVLLHKAVNLSFVRTDKTHVTKMIYLDMEEYRDMEITAEVFTRTLDRPGLEQARAGIALQAYLPDAFAVQQQLTKWAMGRLQSGGAPVTLRIVKGANMEMECVEASISGWAQAPFKSKIETDANYKRMLQYGMEPDHLQAVHLGIASHNLLDLSYALVLAAENDSFSRVQFEMLEGMANHQRRALHEIVSNMLLYAPACAQNDFVNAIGYLIRRLDENTGPDNFLRHAFQLEVASETWQRLEQHFIQSFSAIPVISSTARRLSDEAAVHRSWTPPDSWRQFRGEPNTDFTLMPGRQLAQNVYTRARDDLATGPVEVVPVIAGETIEPDTSPLLREDPSAPMTYATKIYPAAAVHIQRSLRCAQQDPDRWGERSTLDRTNILLEVADRFAAMRTALMASMLYETGKTCAQSDPEISEAIDLIRFYAIAAHDMSRLDAVAATPAGPIVVLSPWNFPVAIPSGGIAAALATGNCVILKPAPAATATALRLCQMFWEGGISRSTLQLVPCLGSVAGAQLVNDPAIHSVVLTGGTQTAERLLSQNPRLRLFAETGGKNATIVSALSDRDLAIKHVADSAFSYSGQKCSATSLLILEAEVYDDPQFKSSLVDAISSLPVGSAWQPETSIGPLIDPPKNHLQKAIHSLDQGESWALKPSIDSHNPRLVSPGIKWDVLPDSYSHQTEFFGPILSVLRAENLQQAIDIANGTPYGLTSGLESLDDREQEEWQTSIRAGNLYINRPTTGAIVLRQPFGGFRKSCFGPGFKAGGPHYVNLFTRFTNQCSASCDRPTGILQDTFESISATAPGNNKLTACLERVGDAFSSYEKYYEQEYGVSHDHFQLIGQDNIRRYLPCEGMVLRIEENDTLLDNLLRIGAAHLLETPIAVALSPSVKCQMKDILSTVAQAVSPLFTVFSASDEELLDWITDGQCLRIRYAAPSQPPTSVQTTAHRRGVALIDAPVISHGLIELAWYFREQSLSADYHRYGNLGVRSGESRAETF